MILYYKKWENPIVFNEEEPLIISFSNFEDLYLFQKSINDSINDCSEEISILNNEKSIKIDKEVEFISNITDLSINNRKMINFLHKKIIDVSSKTNLVLEIEQMSEFINKILLDIRKESLIEFDYDTNLNLADVLKIKEVKFFEKTYSFTELIIRYINLLSEMTNVKILVLSLALFLLPKVDIQEIVSCCKMNNISLIFIEKNCSNDNIGKTIKIL